MHSTLLTCVRTRCRTSLVFAAVLLSYVLLVCLNTADLHSYMLQNLVGTHCCPTFVRAARIPSTLLTYVRTRCKTSLVPTAVVDSYALLVCRLHRRPGFAHVAEHRWYPLLSYIRTRCSYAINIVDLRSHALQSFVGTHCCPTFVRAARMPLIPLTCICTRCRSPLVPTAVLYSYVLLVRSQHR